MFSYAVKGICDKIYSASFDEAIAKFEAHYQKIDALQKETDIRVLKGWKSIVLPRLNGERGLLKR